MNKRLVLALVAALGLAGKNAWAEDIQTGEIVINDFSFYGLPHETVRVLSRLRAMQALKIVKNENGTELRIDPRRVSSDLFIRLQLTENAELDRESGDYVLTDSLSAALAASGALSLSLSESEEPPITLEDLIEKVGDDLDESILKHGFTNLM